jgi:hypothetical protein
MKEHFCPAEQSTITYQGECSWCGEQEALAQTQEPVPPPWWPAVENILTEYGLQAIDFVADFKQALAQTQEPVCPDCKAKVLYECVACSSNNYPPQRTWVGLTDEDKKQMAKEANYHWEMTAGEYAELIGHLTEAKLKELNT